MTKKKLTYKQKLDEARFQIDLLTKENSNLKGEVIGLCDIAARQRIVLENTRGFLGVLYNMQYDEIDLSGYIAPVCEYLNEFLDGKDNEEYK